jgi:hypothetical protein
MIRPYTTPTFSFPGMTPLAMTIYRKKGDS